MLKFPARFEPAEEGGYNVTFRDIPEAITQGDDGEDATNMAADALLTAMEFYFADKRPVPDPSATEDGEHEIALPASVALKVQILNAMVRSRVRPVELASAMGVIPQEVTRILNLRHATRIDTLAGALRALGMDLQLKTTTSDRLWISWLEKRKGFGALVPTLIDTNKKVIRVDILGSEAFLRQAFTQMTHYPPQAALDFGLIRFKNPEMWDRGIPGRRTFSASYEPVS